MSTSQTGERISTQTSHEVLGALRRIAQREHRDIEALLDEALRDYVARKEHSTPDPAIMSAFEESLEQYEALYRKLAQ